MTKKICSFNRIFVGIYQFLDIFWTPYYTMTLDIYL